jgi:hypothetical protein
MRVFALSKIQECINFPQIWEPLPMSRRQKGDIRQLQIDDTHIWGANVKKTLVAGAREVLTHAMT